MSMPYVRNKAVSSWISGVVVFKSGCYDSSTNSFGISLTINIYTAP